MIQGKEQVQKTKAVQTVVVNIQNYDLISNLLAPCVENCYNEWRLNTVQI